MCSAFLIFTKLYQTPELFLNLAVVNRPLGTRVMTSRTLLLELIEEQQIHCLFWAQNSHNSTSQSQSLLPLPSPLLDLFFLTHNHLIFTIAHKVLPVHCNSILIHTHSTILTTLVICTLSRVVHILFEHFTTAHTHIHPFSNSPSTPTPPSFKCDLSWSIQSLNRYSSQQPSLFFSFVCCPHQTIQRRRLLHSAQSALSTFCWSIVPIFSIFLNPVPNDGWQCLFYCRPAWCFVNKLLFESCCCFCYWLFLLFGLYVLTLTFWHPPTLLYPVGLCFEVPLLFSVLFCFRFSFLISFLFSFSPPPIDPLLGSAFQ